jgi:hypothetical protein
MPSKWILEMIQKFARGRVAEESQQRCKELPGAVSLLLGSLSLTARDSQYRNRPLFGTHRVQQA